MIGNGRDISTDPVPADLPLEKNDKMLVALPMVPTSILSHTVTLFINDPFIIMGLSQTPVINPVFLFSFNVPKVPVLIISKTGSLPRHYCCSTLPVTVTFNSKPLPMILSPLSLQLPLPLPLMQAITYGTVTVIVTVTVTLNAKPLLTTFLHTSLGDNRH